MRTDMTKLNVAFRNFANVPWIAKYPGYQMKKDQIVGTCSTHGEKETRTQGVGWKLNQKDVWEDLGIEGRILKRTRVRGLGKV